jgi:hypothetical protein
MMLKTNASSSLRAYALKTGESEGRSQMKSRIQKPEVRSQNERAENRFYRFSFLVSPGFWILTPAFPVDPLACILA